MRGAENSLFLSVSIAAFLTVGASSPARAQDPGSSLQNAIAGQDRMSSRSHSMRAAIGREATRLAAAGGRGTTWQPSVPSERNWVDGHRVGAGPVMGVGAATTWQTEAVQQERSWVGRHPALTGALVGALRQ